MRPWCTYTFPNFERVHCSMSVLTVASGPAYRFLRKQVSWYDILISLRIFHSLLWSTQSKVLTQSMNQCIFGLPLLFYDPMDVGNLISSSSVLSSLNICNFLVHVLLKPSLKNFEHYQHCQHVKWAQLYSSLNILWHCSSVELEWKWAFLVLWPLMSFPNLLAYWVQHFNSIIF